MKGFLGEWRWVLWFKGCASIFLGTVVASIISSSMPFPTTPILVCSSFLLLSPTPNKLICFLLACLSFEFHINTTIRGSLYPFPSLARGFWVQAHCPFLSRLFLCIAEQCSSLHSPGDGHLAHSQDWAVQNKAASWLILSWWDSQWPRAQVYVTDLWASEGSKCLYHFRIHSLASRGYILRKLNWTTSSYNISWLLRLSNL